MYNCAKFHQCRICVTDFREERPILAPTPHPWGAPKKPTLNRVKFTAEWSKTSINFLDATVFLIEVVIETDSYVKETDSHQYLQSSSCHSFHCKKSITYSQALKLNRTCSETNSFDKHCNYLERLLLEIGWNSKLMQI